MNGKAAFGRTPFALRTTSLHGEGFDLSVLNERFIAPLFAARGWPALDLRGRADFAASADGTGLHSVKLRLTAPEAAALAGRLPTDATGIPLDPDAAATAPAAGLPATLARPRTA